jgi:hypothetical protein
MNIKFLLQRAEIAPLPVGEGWYIRSDTNTARRYLTWEGKWTLKPVKALVMASKAHADMLLRIRKAGSRRLGA